MTLKKVVSHGHWESPITADSVAYGTRSVLCPVYSNETGKAYFVEGSAGRSYIAQVDTDDSVTSVLPEPYNVGNSVYEYGAEVMNILPDGRLIFSDHDNSAKVLNPETSEVKVVAEDPVMRYSSFNAHPNSPWVLAIEEDHTNNTPKEIRNYIVAINVDTCQVKRVITGADFYYCPQFSLDGSRVTWLQWDHPNMMFDHAEVHHGAWNEDATVDNIKFVVGKNIESAAEPRWGRDGSLFFAQEVDGFRQLFRIPPGSDTPEQIKLEGLEKAELGEVSLREGSKTFVPLSERYLLATVWRVGIATLISIDLETKQWQEVASEQGICHILGNAMTRIDDSSAIVLGSPSDSFRGVYRINIHESDKNKVLRTVCDDESIPTLFSKPESICVQSKGSPSREIHGFYYAPKNPKFTAPEDELPPVIIMVHGGPTGLAGCGLNLRTQYFTSRGYAFVQLNYTGSTGFGREYRRRLLGRWGIIDAADAAEFVAHLVDVGKARPGSAGITGPSAGGYNTLQCAVEQPDVFAGGVCVCGVSDLKTFSETTHKLEWDYADWLLLPDGSTEEEAAKIYYDRSSKYHADKIETPLLILHGTADTVVPVEQAEVIESVIKKKGGIVELVEVEDEGHMFGKPTSVVLWIEQEERWWRRTLLNV